MTLVFCRECRTQVSSEAPTCPSCGVPQPAHVVSTPAYGLDPQIHAWLFDQLSGGIPRAPLSKHLVDTYAIPAGDAKRIVSKVEIQALSATGVSAVPVRDSGNNVAPALLSLWIPGLGQLTQGRVGRGFCMFGASALLWVVLLGWVVHITAAVDAAKWDPIDEV